MNWSALIHASLLLVMGGKLSASLSEPLIGGPESGLMNFGGKDGGQRMDSFMLPLETESALEPTTNHEVVNQAKLAKTHLLSQQDFPLLIATDRYGVGAAAVASAAGGARVPYPYGKLSNKQKYLLKPIRELNVANSLLNNRLIAGEESTSRARRYAYPQTSQSFLRFGRRNKRPQDGKDTAFLRFGRSDPQERQQILENTLDSLQ